MYIIFTHNEFHVECIIDCGQAREQIVEDGISIWIKMCTALQARMPDNLTGEDPTIVVEILTVSDIPCGVSQAALRKQFGIHLSQSALSKLMERLIRDGWVDFARPVRDARHRPMKTSRAGRKWIAALQKDFNAILAESFPPPKRPNRKAKGNEASSKWKNRSIFDSPGEQPEATTVSDPENWVDDD
jgi:hypothetical protein